MSAQDNTAGTHVPLDVETMRESAARLPAADAELPTAEELDTLILMLRGPAGRRVSGMRDLDDPGAARLARYDRRGRAAMIDGTR